MSNTKTDIHQNRPPRALATDAEDSVQLGAAGANDLWTPYGGVPEGKLWLEVGCSATATVAFSRTATALGNGVVIVPGHPQRFYVDPAKDKFLVSDAAVTWRRVGHICERSRQ